MKNLMHMKLEDVRDTRLRVYCMLCAKEYIFRINDKSLDLFQQGYSVQDAFYYLQPNQRELLISRVCPDCWDKTFGKGEE